MRCRPPTATPELSPPPEQEGLSAKRGAPDTAPAAITTTERQARAPCEMISGSSSSSDLNRAIPRWPGETHAWRFWPYGSWVPPLY